MNTTEYLITSLYHIGAIQFGEFTLKSGVTSKIYINLRKIISYPDILRAVAEAMWDATQDCAFDVVCGVPYTALPIATCLSLAHNVPMIMRRKEKKDYGTKQRIEGVFEKGQKCLIIEDIVTSGTSIVETAIDLESDGLVITDVVALIDRQQGARETLEEKYTLHTILSLSTVLETLKNYSLVSIEERQIIDEFLHERSA